jgi:four helix bundle protein
MQLAKAVYPATRAFPREELYGLVSQMRRAAVSVPSNIAEGHTRRTTGEFLQFLGQAQGSLAEVETLVLLAQELGLLAPEAAEDLLRLAAETNRVLHGLVRSLTPNP